MKCLRGQITFAAVCTTDRGAFRMTSKSSPFPYVRVTRRILAPALPQQSHTIIFLLQPLWLIHGDNNQLTRDTYLRTVSCNCTSMTENLEGREPSLSSGAPRQLGVCTSAIWHAMRRVAVEQFNELRDVP